jgi:hypothetical protein
VSRDRIESTNVPAIRSYGCEMSRTRMWQEAALVALREIMRADPPSLSEIMDGGMDAYAIRVNRAAFEVADVFERQHGPSVSARLQRDVEETTPDDYPDAD